MLGGDLFGRLAVWAKGGADEAVDVGAVVGPATAHERELGDVVLIIRRGPGGTKDLRSAT